MRLETERLFLRNWEEEDAPFLYELAKEEQIGLRAGWLPHQSEQESLDVLKTILIAPESYAIVRKADRTIVGCIGLMIGPKSNLHLPETEAEIGYWMGLPYWGNGYTPEALQELIRHALEDLQLQEIWCAYFDGNENSRRVQEKCGFVYHHTNRVFWEPFNQTMIEHVMRYRKRQRGS